LLTELEIIIVCKKIALSRGAMNYFFPFMDTANYARVNAAVSMK
jgi:hypothetical protein